MKRLVRTRASCLFAAAVVALVAVQSSSATTSIAGSGDLVPTSTALTSRTVGENVIFAGSGTHAWTGSLTGSSVIDVHFVLHPSGIVTYQGFTTFVGTTPCGSGTVQFTASGSGPFPGPITGHSTTSDQAAASVALHADLDTVLFLTPAGAVVTYSGEVRCG